MVVLKKYMNSIFVKNVLSLYCLTLAKILLPLVSLPYLTRVLSVDTYGVVAYVKALMCYVQLVVDFGYMFSATKLVVRAKDDSGILSKIVGVTTGSRIILSILAFIGLFLCVCFIEIISEYKAFTLLMGISTCLTIFMIDFYFRGIERMEVLSFRFLLSKFIVLILTILLVNKDTDILILAAIEILGTLIAVGFTIYEVAKDNLEVYIPSLNECLSSMRLSGMYFVSNLASVTFNVLNTLIIGIFLSNEDVAYWAIAMQVVTGLHMLCSPVIDAIYPVMIRNFNSRLIYKILSVVLFCIILLCLILVFCGEEIVVLIFGHKYVASAQIIIYLIPLIIISFPATLLGFPILGAISKIREITISTVCAALTQIILLLLFIGLDYINILSFVILRVMAEAVMFLIRCFFIYRYRNDFNIMCSR